MARSTWTQIKASPVDSADYLKNAGAFFDKALTQGQGALTAYDTRRQTDITDTLMQKLRNAQAVDDIAGVRTAASNAQIDQNRIQDLLTAANSQQGILAQEKLTPFLGQLTDPNLTPEQFKTLSAQRDDLLALGNDTQDTALLNALGTANQTARSNLKYNTQQNNEAVLQDLYARAADIAKQPSETGLVDLRNLYDLGAQQGLSTDALNTLQQRLTGLEPQVSAYVTDLAQRNFDAATTVTNTNITSGIKRIFDEVVPENQKQYFTFDQAGNPIIDPKADTAVADAVSKRVLSEGIYDQVIPIEQRLEAYDSSLRDKGIYDPGVREQLVEQRRAAVESAKTLKGENLSQYQLAEGAINSKYDQEIALTNKEEEVAVENQFKVLSNDFNALNKVAGYDSLDEYINNPTKDSDGPKGEYESRFGLGGAKAKEIFTSVQNEGVNVNGQLVKPSDAVMIRAAQSLFDPGGIFADATFGGSKEEVRQAVTAAIQKLAPDAQLIDAYVESKRGYNERRNVIESSRASDLSSALTTAKRDQGIRTIRANKKQFENASAVGDYQTEQQAKVRQAEEQKRLTGKLETQAKTPLSLNTSDTKPGDTLTASSFKSSGNRNAQPGFENKITEQGIATLKNMIAKQNPELTPDQVQRVYDRIDSIGWLENDTKTGKAFGLDPKFLKETRKLLEAGRAGKLQ